MGRVLLRVLAITIAVNVLLTLVALAVRRLLPSHGDETSDEIALVAAAHGIDLRSRAASFRGGSVRAFMGGVRLDLREATLAPNGGRLEVLAVMGGVQVLVPGGWQLRVAAAHVFAGGVDHPRVETAVPEQEPALELVMTAIVGGVQVASPRRGRQQAPVPDVPATT